MTFLITGLFRLSSWLFPSHYTITELKMAADNMMFRLSSWLFISHYTITELKMAADNMMFRLSSWLFPSHYTITELKMAAVTEWGDSSLIPYEGTVYIQNSIYQKSALLVFEEDPPKNVFFRVSALIQL